MKRRMSTSGSKMFANISFSDPNVINALIRYRSKLDPYYVFESNHVDDLIDMCISETENVLGKKLQVNKVDKEPLPMNDISPFNEDLICTYVTLDDLIKESSLTERQSLIIGLMMMGFKAVEIALYLNSRADRINKVINDVSKKIANDYKKKWKYRIADEGWIRVRWDYKKCSSCGEIKPSTLDFYGKNHKTKDKLQSVCKACDNLRKKGG